ncbi:uncharacterized protein [Procambarus clarkii]|uniref:uncharacterized protein n=1 Tax=Procambarus clarkii TaxID=6728 RepID=UPI0037444956
MGDDDSAALKESINEELRDYYVQLVNIYRPDLRDEVKAKVPPGDPIFHDLQPYSFHADQLELKPEDYERDHRKIAVADLLTTQLQEEEETSELPTRLLLLGHPESGKTALFALLIHYWLHDKTKVKDLEKVDILVAIQCLGLPTSAKVDFMKDLLARLPKSTEKHGEKKILESMKEMKILVLIDTLDSLPSIVDENSLAPWTGQRVIIFSRLKYMKDNPQHPLRYQQSKENMVLQLLGGVISNPYTRHVDPSEAQTDGFGCFSGKLFENYCKRLCLIKNQTYGEFNEHLKELLKTLPVEMRKPFNIYMFISAIERDRIITAKTVSELYSKWFELWSHIYKGEVHSCTLDLNVLITSGTLQIGMLAYEAFKKEKEYLFNEEYSSNKQIEEIEPFLAHVLVPHYNSRGKIQTLTFRIAPHQTFFMGKHIANKINHSLDTIENILNQENYRKICSVLPMVIGLMRGDAQFDKIKEHAIKLGKLMFEDEYKQVTKNINDPIINSAVQILAESGLYSKTDDKYDEFVKELLNTLRDDNWCIVDGNLLPQALKALCNCGHERSKGIPQKLNISLGGRLSEMPGLADMLEAVRGCDLRLGLQINSSFMGMDEMPLDEIIKALHAKGRASLGKFTGYLKDVRILDSHPATRRIYNISLRIIDHEQYENLYKICKSSNKLNRVMLRISDADRINAKKLKELPSSITHLTVYIEGVTDAIISAAIAIWRAIRGNTKRKDQEYLRFWDVDEKKLSPSGVMQLIEANMPASRIDVPLQQPLTEYDEKRIQEKLNTFKDNNFKVKLLGSVKHPRRDLKPQK